MDQFKLFQEIGVVGKLHNFVNSQLSKQSVYNFGTLQLFQDGELHWHFVYLMLLHCLEL
ncbi:hypothetical protein K458DRAFT_388708 [Lentithecium fluviatile CBS 122367]|uniref:Uncharacterized protein n=1 Tax=Lentithecium fluviatile CBS 122367 TaxID=1168545 RepID=A0A6G1J444_9PLEO|nr:hypothetical protein K458DRAFT_388708 [Lentithecium fluviatile CBS 122367]